MKKSTVAVVGVVAVTPPILIGAFDINPITMITNRFGFSLPYDKIVGSMSNPFISQSEAVNEMNGEVKGEMVYVMHYEKRSNKKEMIDIYLDSNTLDQEENAFIKVSLYNSEGGKDFETDTEVIQFKGNYHYEIEFDPPTIENEIERKVVVSSTFYSNDDERHQQISFFVQYEQKEKVYEFNNNVEYKSTCPIAIKHNRDGTKEEIYENFHFDSLCNQKFNKPIFDLKEFYFKYNYDQVYNDLPYYDECYLLVDDLYDNSDFKDENEMKKIPLKLTCEEGLIKFYLANNCFYDSNDGMIYENNEIGRRMISNLFIPTTYNNDKESIYYEIHIKNLGSGSNDYIFKSYAYFEIKWFGNCNSSYFCIESYEEMLDDAYYSGGIVI